ncbi:hypothetical protein M1N80_01485 [Peptococcaceae bacterium]|nr:hypothetical protein [Peptococcaceae bacterium]MCL0100473.1 hypothetical protein [Peptococcaceae bacterium]MCL0106379.1 hypothetical protein [Peptococcaceae bacterium]
MSIAADISYTFDYSNKDIVRWIEKGHTIDGVEALSLYAVPVETGEMLYSHLYTQKKSIIFTSATLTVDGAFDYFIERVGLDLIHEDQLWPPNIPIIEARHELLSKQSKNGFENFSLPEAVIKFKQGFGRLIRKNSDFGAVIVLDRRIIEKRYGLSLLRSLPVNTYMKGNRYQMISTIKRWLS